MVAEGQTAGDLGAAGGEEMNLVVLGAGCWVRGAKTFLASMLVTTLITTPLFAQAPDRSKAPGTGPAPALKVPPLQKRTLANGLSVWIVEMHEVPVVDVTLIV